MFRTDLDVFEFTQILLLESCTIHNMSEPTKFYTPVPSLSSPFPGFLTLESNGKAWIFYYLLFSDASR